jgi:hypothetical protein
MGSFVTYASLDPTRACHHRQLAAAARALNDGRSLRQIAAALAEQGFVTPSGKTYAQSAVKGMLAGELKGRALKRTDAKGRRIPAT